jgi:hypothetical protein
VVLIVGIRAQPQGPIIHETSTAKGPSQDLLLLSRGVPSVLVGSFLFHMPQDIIYLVESQQLCAIHLPPEGGKSSGAFSIAPPLGKTPKLPQMNMQFLPGPGDVTHSNRVTWQDQLT